MQICTTVAEVRALVDAWHKEGKTVGLVPTMGFLHEGHESLIQKAVAENDCVVVSDFVNPTQFGQDQARCEKNGAAAIFHPTPEEMYHDPAAYVNIEGLSSTLCGKSRPIHFRGVCTVVSKLFNIVRPERAYFGEKDAQQLAIIRKMVTDLNFPVTIVGCPIVREEDGLAKSSRNTYLSAAERRAALCLSQAVKQGQQTIAPKMAAADVLQPMREILENEPLARVDYLEMVDAQTMQPADRVDRAVLVAMAVYIGKTRLIDNFSFDPAGAR